MTPFTRIPNETAKQYAAFLRYRDMEGERSIRRACGSVSRLGYWGRWSVKNHWVARCAAYDAEKERIARVAASEEFSAIQRERLRLAIRRAKYEIERQERVEDLIERLDRKIDALLALPNTDIEQVKYGADGKIASRQSIKGIRPGELARVIEAWLAAIVVGVHGHVRISRSERIPEPIVNGDQSTPDTTPMHLVMDEWPDEPVGVLGSSDN